MLTLIFNIKGAAKPRGYVYLIEPDVRRQCLDLLEGDTARDCTPTAAAAPKTDDANASPPSSASGAGEAAAGGGVLARDSGGGAGGGAQGNLIDLLGDLPAPSVPAGSAAAAPAAGMGPCVYTPVHVCAHTCACARVSHADLGLAVSCAFRARVRFRGCVRVRAAVACVPCIW